MYNGSIIYVYFTCYKKYEKNGYLANITNKKCTKSKQKCKVNLIYDPLR